MHKLNTIEWIALILVIIGGINWGLWGLFEFNAVGAIFGELTTLARIVYIVVGLAALYILIDSFMYGHKENRRTHAHTPRT